MLAEQQGSALRKLSPGQNCGGRVYRHGCPWRSDETRMTGLPVRHRQLPDPDSRAHPTGLVNHGNPFSQERARSPPFTSLWISSWSQLSPPTRNTVALLTRAPREAAGTIRR
jgi:hypothetical protein